MARRAKRRSGRGLGACSRKRKWELQGGVLESKNVNNSLHVEQKGGLGGSSVGAPGGAPEGENVDISLHVEQKGVLGGGSGDVPESENGSSRGLFWGARMLIFQCT